MANNSSESKAGYVKIHRSMFDNPLFSKHPEFIGPWVWMIAQARFKPNGIGRGQLELSLRFLRRKFPYLSHAKSQRFIDTLIDTQMVEIDTQSDTRGRLITICNYDKYQADQHAGDTAGDTEGQKIDTLSDTRIKKVKEGRKNDNSSRSRGTRLPADFELPEDWKNWVLVNMPAFPAEQIAAQADQFRDYWISQPGQKGVKLNWQATWRNWIRNARIPDRSSRQAKSSSVLAARLQREQERANG